MGTFSGTEFRAIYDQHTYTHLKKITSPPPITDNEAIDAHIQALAVSRGYKLRSIATAPLTAVDNFTLQPQAAEAWQALKAGAAADSLELRLVAGYREFADQRALFLNSLANTGIDTATIPSGAADTQLGAILQTVSIPGYSKHHTGYTVDIGCGGYGTFVNSPCFGWLSADNYANAKKFGWIPSYPPDTSSQGPQPEPWEYVWVGTEALMREAP
jgi:D-alanyl-D-alanine carboxypeptidase